MSIMIVRLHIQHSRRIYYIHLTIHTKTYFCLHTQNTPAFSPATIFFVRVSWQTLLVIGISPYTYKKGVETFTAAHSKYRGSRIAHTDRTSNTQPHADMNNFLHAIQQAIMRQKHCQPMAISTRRMYNCTHPMGIYLLQCPLSVHFEFARFRYYRTQRM